MTQKNCLNCAYLCHRENSKTLESWPKSYRSDEPSKWHGMNAKCFHEQWTRPTNETLEDTIDEVMERSFREGRGQYTNVKDSNGNWISLSDSRECEFFHKFNPESSKPLDRIWQEQEQALREAKDRRRFVIMALIGCVTAAAVIATAAFQWLEWSSKP